MKTLIIFLLAALGLSLSIPHADAQERITVRFEDSGEVLTNPGIGFMTFQRFNGDKPMKVLDGPRVCLLNTRNLRGALLLPIIR